tara:strand:+ start:804 stop:1145 length:342 start_codon:yes stop_codon:yes gene_type:complete
MKIYTFQIMLKDCEGERLFQRVLRTSKREITKARNLIIKKFKIQEKEFELIKKRERVSDQDYFDYNVDLINEIRDRIESDYTIEQIYEIKTFEIPINKQGILKAWTIGYVDME